ncbi:hypothetical protein X975_01519, partial [Stegodyphus mimosarum]
MVFKAFRIEIINHYVLQVSIYINISSSCVLLLYQHFHNCKRYKYRT